MNQSGLEREKSISTDENKMHHRYHHDESRCRRIVRVLEEVVGEDLPYDQISEAVAKILVE